MKISYFLLTFLFATTTFGIAQKPEDRQSASDKLHVELINQLNASRKDISRARLLVALADFHWHNKREEDSVLGYAEEARELSEILKFDSGYNEATKNDALRAIENSQHRVYAMSLIHQKLYQAENVKTVEMSDYLPEFIRYLKESFGITSHIVFQLEIDSLELDISHAIPIALIVNEAVTNSIKYAFPENRAGIINITMQRFGENALLIIADNGIGIKQDISNTTTNSLGMELIKGLSDDINGDIRFQNDNGTKISIEFKIDTISGTTSALILPEEVALA